MICSRPRLATTRLRVGRLVSSGPLGRNRFGPKPLAYVGTLYKSQPFPHVLHFTHTHTSPILSQLETPNQQHSISSNFRFKHKNLGQETRSKIITRTLHLLGSFLFVFGSFFFFTTGRGDQRD
ncbi:hypothetical protein HanPSC8_Chr12g0544461 [Helianthus annuus]|uniref:Uncharacterized protein n=1 Tax=Helianthus annuus TaxID=4232 RepID=A0A251T5L2_HELAN|nr:hypothetical protein HanPSC8_Chr12g0544461 [Helianthus annuus]